MLWWDTRKLGEPLEKMMLEDKANEGRLIGGVALEYTSIGGKFLVATEQGTIIACNRAPHLPRARTADEPPPRRPALTCPHLTRW